MPAWLRGLSPAVLALALALALAVAVVLAVVLNLVLDLVLAVVLALVLALVPILAGSLALADAASCPTDRLEKAVLARDHFERYPERQVATVAPVAAAAAAAAAAVAVAAGADRSLVLDYQLVLYIGSQTQTENGSANVKFVGRKMPTGAVYFGSSQSCAAGRGRPA